MSRFNLSSTSSQWTSHNVSLSRNFDQSLSQSGMIAECSQHKLESYGSLLPVLVIEAISTEAVSYGSCSVKISERGWAWLVCGRRLFVWKFKSSSAKKSSSCSCYELELPPSDLDHKADLVALLLPSENQAVGVVAVSPEGILRYWPNVAYEGHSIETNVADLQGQECDLLVSVDPSLCILGTTTSSLVCISINNADVNFRTLRVPQGVLAGFGKRVTSFIFGAMPATVSEARHRVKILRAPGSDNQQTIYVLAGLVFQKWLLYGPTERLAYDQEVDRVLRDAFIDEVWNRASAHPNNLKLYAVDACIRKANQLIVLVACSNPDLSNVLHYAVATFIDKGMDASTLDAGGIPSTPLVLNSFSVLRNHSLDPVNDQEELVFKSRLLAVPPESSSLIYVYDKTQVLCVQNFSDVVDVIDFNRQDDGILGAGFCESTALLFTCRDALVSVTPTTAQTASLQGLTVPSINLEVGSSDDKLDQLKKAFYLYAKRETAQCEALLQDAFARVSPTELGETVAELSRELCDATPSSDPRWAESEARPLTGALTANIVIGKQIEEKLSTHVQLIDFLKNSSLWAKLEQPLGRKANYLPAQLILFESLEKLTCAYALKCKQTPLAYLLEPVIRFLVEKRGQRVPNLLTPLDLFYRDCSKFYELFSAFVDYEEGEIAGGQASTRQSFNLVSSFTEIIRDVFGEIQALRGNLAPDYAVFAGRLDEFVPWDASLGKNETRTSLMRQYELVLELGVAQQVATGVQEDVEFKGAVYQKLSELADIILGSYAHQLKLLKADGEERQRVLKNFELDRSKLLAPLLKARQYERATALAEKYLDFDSLIQVCEELDAKERLQRYCVLFGEQRFSDHLLNWYVKEGKQAKMLQSSAVASDQSLTGFLKDHEELQWLHQIGTDRFKEASQTLFALGASEASYLPRKKTLLSLSKLAALATSRDTDVAPINDALDRVYLQESEGLTPR